MNAPKNLLIVALLSGIYAVSYGQTPTPAKPAKPTTSVQPKPAQSKTPTNTLMNAHQSKAAQHHVKKAKEEAKKG
jgi:hypothetical protein